MNDLLPTLATAVVLTATDQAAIHDYAIAEKSAATRRAYRSDFAAFTAWCAGRGAGWMEILVGVDRRRRWRAEEKLRIVAETKQPGASFATVARRHEISRGLLWNWRQQVRRGALAPAQVQVAERSIKAAISHAARIFC